MITIAQGIQLLDFAHKVLLGGIDSPAELAKGLVGLALDLAPVEDLKEYLTEEARKRDDAIADAAQELKLGGK